MLMVIPGQTPSFLRSLQASGSSPGLGEKPGWVHSTAALLSDLVTQARYLHSLSLGFPILKMIVTSHFIMKEGIKY